MVTAAKIADFGTCGCNTPTQPVWQRTPPNQVTPPINERRLERTGGTKPRTACSDWVSTSHLSSVWAVLPDTSPSEKLPSSSRAVLRRGLPESGDLFTMHLLP